MMGVVRSAWIKYGLSQLHVVLFVIAAQFQRQVSMKKEQCSRSIAPSEPISAWFAGMVQLKLAAYTLGGGVSNVLWDVVAKIIHAGGAGTAVPVDYNLFFCPKSYDSPPKHDVFPSLHIHMPASHRVCRQNLSMLPRISPRPLQLCMN